MTPDELVIAAEIKLRDADNNLAGCVAAMNEHKRRTGSVPNSEVVAMAHLQAAVSQAYAHVALAKTAMATWEAMRGAEQDPVGGEAP